MKDLAKRGEKLWNKNPALRKADWLPEGVSPELDELHQRHVDSLGKLSDATQKASDLRKGYEAEDKARQEAAMNGGEPPAMTDEATRQNTLSDATAAAVSAQSAVYVFLATTIATIQEKEDEWLAELKKRDAAAEDKRAEALRLLDEADQDVWVSKRASIWIERTAEDKPMRHVAYEQIAGPVPHPPEVQLDPEQLVGRA